MTMSSESDRLPCPFDAREREFIRREFGVHFGQPWYLADGILLRTWRSGPEKNQPKLPPAVRSMIERGLVEVRPGSVASSQRTVSRKCGSLWLTGPDEPEA